MKFFSLQLSCINQNIAILRGWHFMTFCFKFTSTSIAQENISRFVTVNALQSMTEAEACGNHEIT